MKVRATEVGFFNGSLVYPWEEGKPGGEFEIETIEQFAALWMAPVGWDPSKAKELKKQ